MKIAYVGIDLLYGALSYLSGTEHDIMKIFTCKTDNFTEFNTKIISFARENNIPCTLDRITGKDVENLVKDGCELLVCAGYYFKIPVNKHLMQINVHPALLPNGRGPWPMPYDILGKKRESGVTIHKIADGFDEGDIVLQRKFELSDSENLETLMYKVNNILPEMLSEFLKSPKSLYENAKPQGAGTYLKMPEKDAYTVSGDTQFETAERILRAFYGYECFYRTNDGEKCLIKATAKRTLDGIKDDETAFELKDGYVVCKKSNVYDV